MNDLFPQVLMLFTSEIVQPGETNLMNQIQMLQCRVNNLSTKKKKASFALFKVKQRNIYGLALIDTGNLFHSAIVSRDFWESIGARSTFSDIRIKP